MPTYSRPRDGRESHGSAVERPLPPVGGGGNVYYVPVYYYPYGYYPYSYLGGYGLGYGFGYIDGGFGYGGYGYGDPYSSGSYGGGGSGSYDREPRDTGSLRLKINPREAQVYVDGYLVGDVDSFDGAFQKLGIESGGHKVELKADGYEPLQFDVLIPPGETVTYKGEMKRIK